jgi:hypothetical protein
MSHIGSIRRMLREGALRRGERVLFVRAAGGLQFGVVALAIDVAHGANVDRVALMPRRVTTGRGFRRVSRGTGSRRGSVTEVSPGWSLTLVVDEQFVLGAAKRFKEVLAVDGLHDDAFQIIVAAVEHFASAS